TLPGTYTITLTATNTCGSAGSVTHQVTATNPILIAAFTSNVTSGTGPLDVQFTDQSTGGTINGWQWNFGDGTANSTAQNPNHQFTSPGTYTVTLTVTNQYGTTTSTTRTITVTCQLIAAAFVTNTTTGPAPLTVAFTDQSTGGTINGWQWNFGDGTANETAQNPVHTFTLPGTFTITLTATNTCGSAGSVTHQVTVTNPILIAAFTSNVTSGTGPLDVQFTDQSTGGTITSWQWNFGDGTANSTAQNPNHQFTSPGTYTVTLTVTNQFGTTASTTRTITVTCQIITAAFVTNTTTGSAPLTVAFTDQSTGGTINGWQWNFGDGTANETAQNPVHTFTLPGAYTITLTATNTCGSIGSVTHQVTATNPILIAAFTPNVTSGTAPLDVQFTDQSIGGTITSWQWNFSDGTPNSTVQNPEHLFMNLGTYTVTLTVTNQFGTTASTTRTITVSCPQVVAAFALTPTSGRADLNVSFTDQSTGGTINSWLWDFGDGTSSSQKNPSNIFSDPGTFTVRLTAKNSCGNSNSTTRNLTVGCHQLTADFSYLVNSMNPLNITFTDLSDPTEITSRVWNFGDGTTSMVQNPTHVFSDVQNYNVTLTATNSCGETAQKTRLITFICSTLIPSFNITPTIGFAPLTVTLTDTSTPQANITSWQWFFGDGTYYYTESAANRNPPPHTYTKSGSYIITLMIQNECGDPYSVRDQVTATGLVRIRGNLWDDRNLNGVKDPGELPLSGWNITLQERISGNWVNRTSMFTNATGDYLFTLTDVTYSAFRIAETLKPNWKVTYSYGSGADSTSSTLLAYNERIYQNINFGNVEWHTSRITIPAYLLYRGPPNTWATLNYPNNWPFDYTTSFDSVIRKLWPGSGNQPKPFAPDVNFSAWGNSSFTISPGFYNLYYKSGGTSGYYWLAWWNYNGAITYGYDYPVPDNTTITWNQLNLHYPTNATLFFQIYTPREGETIPYSTSSYVEAHYVGPNENTGGCWLRNPVNVNMPYNTGLGYNTVTWNNTAWEGQSLTLMVNETRLNNAGVATAYKNVTIGWEPIIPVIISPVNNTLIQGTTTITGTVTGKNRDTNNAILYIDNQSVGQMTYNGGTNTFTSSFNAEPYAGKNIKAVIRAYPQAGKGFYVESTPMYYRVKSINPLVAGFTADPPSGPAPLEVVFTDTSTGGPASWQWNFGDGTTNITTRNATHTFQTQGTFPVKLTVRNIDNSQVSSVLRNITTSGTWHRVSLLTSRTGYVTAGGYARWIVNELGSFVTINNIRYNLTMGDTVQMTFQNQELNPRILIVGEIGAMNATNALLTVNGANVAQGPCTAISIPDFINFHSTFNLVATRKTAFGSFVTFFWDGGTPVDFTKSQNKTLNLTISNLMPDTSIYMDLRMPGDQIYFEGRASQYTLS
ncbi:MAG TPA: PKD domain-containing protein, partial [Methanospirillum sp.]|nr:PKD domain-containing protein [Methanospirillum sp.]